MLKNNKNGNNHHLVGGEPFYLEGTNKKGVLLLHGFTSTPYQFINLGKYLNEKGYTVSAPLFAGHGTEPKDLAKTRHADWIQTAEQAMQYLKSQMETVYIVGNSMGGNVALYLAYKYQDKIDGIITLGTPVFIGKEYLVRYLLPIYKYFKKYINKTQDDYKADYTDYSDEVCYSVFPSKTLHDLFIFIKEKFIPILPQVKTPTLIVHANADRWSKPESAQFIHHNLGSKNKKIYWVQTERHVLVHRCERINEVFERIAKFLEEIDPGKNT